MNRIATLVTLLVVSLATNLLFEQTDADLLGKNNSAEMIKVRCA